MSGNTSGNLYSSGLQLGGQLSGSGVIESSVSFFSGLFCPDTQYKVFSDLPGAVDQQALHSNQSITTSVGRKAVACSVICFRRSVKRLLSKSFFNIISAFVATNATRFNEEKIFSFFLTMASNRSDMIWQLSLYRRTPPRSSEGISIRTIRLSDVAKSSNSGFTTSLRYRLKCSPISLAIWGLFFSTDFGNGANCLSLSRPQGRSDAALSSFSRSSRSPLRSRKKTDGDISGLQSRRKLTNVSRYARTAVPISKFSASRACCNRDLVS